MKVFHSSSLLVSRSVLGVKWYISSVITTFSVSEIQGLNDIYINLHIALISAQYISLLIYTLISENMFTVDRRR